MSRATRPGSRKRGARSAPPARGPFQQRRHDDPPAELCDDGFVAVYHEMKAPLGLIATLARMAASEREPDDPLRRRCDTIARVAERTLRTAEQVLEVARAAGAEGEQDGSDFRPAEVVEQLTEELRDAGRAVELQIEESARFATAHGRAAWLEALLQSLLANARDHGDPDAAVQVTLAALPGELLLTVRNRVAAKDAHLGLGIGSYLAQQLAGRLRGRFHGERDGDEYCASLTLPLERLSALA